MNKPNQTYNPAALATTTPTPQVETAAMVLAASAKALVEARYTIALHQPRDLDVVRANFLRECKRASFAEVAVYSKPVGQERITGPSIRFAEAVLQAMGNISIQTPVVYDDNEKRIMRITVMDLERNVTAEGDVTIRKVVERRSLRDGEVAISVRENSRGQKTYLRAATDDEMLNTVNALVSKAIRTLGLRLVPGWLIDEALRECQATTTSNAKSNPDAEKNKLMDAFAGIGITPTMVKEFLGHPGERLQPAELKELRAIFASIRDEETTWRDIMDQRRDELEAAKGTKEPAAQAVAVVAHVPVNPTQAEVKAVVEAVQKEAAKQIVEQVGSHAAVTDEVSRPYQVTDNVEGTTKVADTAVPGAPVKPKTAVDSVRAKLNKLREGTTAPSTLPGLDKK